MSEINDFDIKRINSITHALNSLRDRYLFESVSVYPYDETGSYLLGHIWYSSDLEHFVYDPTFYGKQDLNDV